VFFKESGVFFVCASGNSASVKKGKLEQCLNRRWCSHICFILFIFVNHNGALNDLNMGTTTLHSTPDFGVICSFLVTFGESSGLGKINTKDLEEALENKTEGRPKSS
jgi:hypothetical protein